MEVVRLQGSGWPILRKTQKNSLFALSAESALVRVPPEFEKAIYALSQNYCLSVAVI